MNNRAISIILLVVGAILLFYGIRATDSIGSELSNLFTGAPSDRSIWLLIGGTVAILVGLSGTVIAPRKN
jgi:uncharacterized membrane protein